MGLVAAVLPFAAALLGVALAAAYLFSTRRHSHWAKKGVRHERPLPFVGTLKDVALLRKSIGLMAKDVYDGHTGEPFVGLYAFDEPVLLLRDLDAIKAVLVKDFQFFMDRSVTPNEDLDPLPAKSLFGLKGERWRHCRTAISPSFTSGKMKRMYELVSECGRILVSMVEKEECIDTPVAVYELAARYTADVIASCAFGFQGNTLADPDAEFRHVMRKHFDFTPKRAILFVLAFLAPKLLKMTGLRVILPEVDSFVRRTILSTIREREKLQTKRNDLLDSLIQLKHSGSISDADDDQNKEPSSKLLFNEEDICGHSFAFLVAGFETSASTMSYLLFELANNQDIQKKLREEIQKAMQDGLLTYESLHSMKYLDMVVKETLRKYPILPFIDRRSNKDYELPGSDVVLEKGSRIMVPIYGLHMDPEYHPNPKKFDPQRFSDENKNNIANYTFMPFGEGPRSCVGMRFALMQTKSGIAHLLSRYSVHPCSSTPEEIIFNPKIFLLRPKSKIELILRPLP